MKLETILAIASLSISLVSLVPLFFLREKNRGILITVIIVVLVLSSSVGLYQDYRHRERVEAVSKDIVRELGYDVKTFDQLYEALFYVESPIVNEALNDLVNDGKVGHKILKLRDDLGARFKTRGYYVNSSP